MNEGTETAPPAPAADAAGEAEPTQAKTKGSNSSNAGTRAPRSGATIRQVLDIARNIAQQTVSEGMHCTTHKIRKSQQAEESNAIDR